MKQTIDQRRLELARKKGLLLHQDNVRPHTSMMTRSKPREPPWDVFLHTLYNPDIAPGNSCLFISISEALAGVKLTSKEAFEKTLSNFFENKEAGSYEGGSMELLSRWKQNVKQNDLYLNWIQSL